MAKKKSFAIIGASNFSLSVLATLVEKRQTITMFDIDQDKLDLYLSEFDSVDAIVLDSTNKIALQKNGINSFDGVIVGIASNIEASLMTVLNLTDLGCENIIVKAKDRKHKRILQALGLSENQIIIPDSIAGKIVGTRSVFDIDLDIDVQSIDDDFISTTLTIKSEEIIGRTLQEAGLSTSKDFNIIQIRRKGKTLLPDDYTVLKADDEIVVFAKTTIINNLADKVQTENEDEIIDNMVDFDDLIEETIATSSDIVFDDEILNEQDLENESEEKTKKSKKILRKKEKAEPVKEIILDSFDDIDDVDQEFTIKNEDIFK
ncbi:potassium channel family protein [Mesoplasma photuris]|uniref:potassium channel family protein n=1 Tax=Mesoplasma photuris TaxID=217731 RepID=UPI0009FC102F|nr:TrkA family potassium uptake protein [Mesoplasma photuris]